MNVTRKQYKPKWRGGADPRVVCSCQLHARRERALWRRSLRGAKHFATRASARGIALLLGVPLALGTLDLPTEAMDLRTPANVERPRIVRARAAEFPIFTTPNMRDQFMASDGVARAFNLEAVKEQFFRTHIPYGAIIYREAKRHNVPPELVAAVVEAESDFRPGLISHKNAQGLMQILPSTGRYLGAHDLFDPHVNIATGTRYLRYLLNRFGDQRLALAAYNAGEGNIAKFGGVPPFAETQNYLRKVSSRASHYRQRVRGTYMARLRMRNSIDLE